MYLRISRYFFSVAFVTLMTAQAWSQKKETKVLPIDTVKNKFLPTGFRFGTDAIGIIKSKVKKDWKGWEVNGDLDFDRYYLAVEYGYWARKEVVAPGNYNAGGAPGAYSNSGTYYRIGSDVNFMLKDPEKNMFFLGFRYGTSHFQESLSYTQTDSLPGIASKVTYPVSTTHSGLTAHWVELTTGLRVKIWGPFWMGYTARLKLAPSVRGEGALHTYDIPGYGLKEKSNYWGINYQLFWRIPIRRVKGSQPAK